MAARLGDTEKKVPMMRSNRPASDITGPIRLRTLVVIRWVAITGQFIALLLARFGFGFDLPLGLALVPVFASVLLNIVLGLRYPASKRLNDGNATGYLAYDLVQLAILLYLTGGLTNPFSVLFLVPVTISATILKARSTVILGTIAVLCASSLVWFHRPLPWHTGGIDLPLLYVLGIWAALVLGMSFMAVYAWRVAQETRRMSDALNATQLALAREQRLSALDGLAAAAAHELGTPLGTITVVARELANEVAPDSAMAEDVDLLVSQTERCREILTRLSRNPQGDDSSFTDATMTGLVEAAIEAHFEDEVEIRLETMAADSPQPKVARSPEIVQGLANIIENAADFAESLVAVSINWTDDDITVTVRDDGPGIPMDVLSSLGDPYVTTRRDDGGMGLGVFIAKTLLERTGGEVSFGNYRDPGGRIGGAEVAIAWPRGILDLSIQ